jgi:Methyltransferase small domain
MRYAQSGTVVDATLGNGVSALALLRGRPDVHVIGVDVDEDRCQNASELAISQSTEQRLQVICGDFFSQKLPAVSLVIANPPLIPDEYGFADIRGGSSMPYFARLLEWANNSPNRPEIIVHLFDFVGIETRTGAHEPAFIVARKFDYFLEPVYRGWRRVGPNSRVRAAFKPLAAVFPQGVVYIRGRRYLLSTAPEIDSRVNMRIRHTIARIRPI